jgi:transposase-like protein
VEAMAEDPSLSLDAAVNRVGVRVGVVPDTLRGWAKQYRVNTGQAPGTTTSDARRIKDLEHEVRELKRANEILLARPRVSSRGSSTRDCRGGREPEGMAPGAPRLRLLRYMSASSGL